MGIFSNIKRLFRNRISSDVVFGRRPDPARPDMGFANWVTPSYPLEILPLISKLAKITPDVSQALKRAVALGNSGLIWDFTGTDREKSKAEVEVKAFMDAHPDIVNSLYRQAIMAGGVSAEIVPSLDLDAVEIRLVPHETVRFLETDGRFVPHQKRSDGTTRQLSDTQYVYDPIERDAESPYALPPFMSAIPWLLLQHANADNIKAHAVKWGVLGFIVVLLKKAVFRAGEDQHTAEKRQRDLLERARTDFQKSAGTGFVAAPEGTVIQHHSVSDNAGSFGAITKFIEQQIASGLNIDLFMLGRNDGINFAYARFAGKIYLLTLGNIGHPVKRIMVKAMNEHLRARGVNVTAEASWGKQISLDPEGDAKARKLDAEIEEIRVRTVDAKVAAGYISSDDAAREIGYERATGKAALSATRALSSDDNKVREILEGIQEDYLKSFFSIYKNKVGDLVREAGKLIGEDSLKSPAAAVATADRIVALYRQEMGTKFPDSVYADLKQAMTDSWKSGGNFPAGVDWSKKPAPADAVKFFTKANHFDIGRTFPDYEKDIKEAVLAAIESGKLNSALKELEKAIPGVLEDPRLKSRLGDIFRNLSNRAHSFGRIKRMEEVGIRKLETVAIIDKNTSSLCRILNGKVFDTSALSGFCDDFISTEYDDNFWSKFQNPSENLVKENWDKWSKLEGAELLALLGVQAPPFHFKCRSLVVSK